jgi:hypothetical protein
METEPVFNLKSAVSTAPAGYRFPREVIAVAVRWYLRYRLSRTQRLPITDLSAIVPV